MLRRRPMGDEPRPRRSQYTFFLWAAVTVVLILLALVLSAIGALESRVAANPFKRSSALTTAVRAANASQIAMCVRRTPG